MVVAAGLLNQGNTCYLNSVLQCLAHLPLLANAALDGTLEARVGAHQRGGVLGLLVAHVKEVLAIRGVEATAHRPTAIHSALASMREGTFRLGQQEDAHECLRVLLGAVDADAPSGASVVQWLFGGTLVSRIRCEGCGIEWSPPVESFFDVSLELGADIQTLNGALDAFVRPENLTGDNAYSCEVCLSKQCACRQVQFLKAPRVLAVHFKRFVYGGEGATKIVQHVEFPAALDLRPYMASAGEGGDAGVQVRYWLNGVIVHDGESAGSGHYVAYVRSWDGGQWYCQDARGAWR